MDEFVGSAHSEATGAYRVLEERLARSHRNRFRKGDDSLHEAYELDSIKTDSTYGKSQEMVWSRCLKTISK